ncbi:hypothetical protein IU433_25955 [Nocardia puris]|uniref:hypothetical protein n=1 Tax=Nocardia puris TaxID=208602 RepID=UPI0011BE9757|nr:hypothetical protein [Nocardia puris]MBF6214646.1 hypothetical protein [Nocardia puris]MBF6368879.1 hypothetical protein [Nocardia puris]MBF6462460.1 hypothetical protein [Nocardia puris]
MDTAYGVTLRAIQQDLSAIRVWKHDDTTFEDSARANVAARGRSELVDLGDIDWCGPNRPDDPDEATATVSVRYERPSAETGSATARFRATYAKQGDRWQVCAIE